MTEPSPVGRAIELSVVLPVYNEAENIAGVLRQAALQIAASHEVIVVYDFDGDTTVPVVEDLLPAMPGVRLLKNGIGPGVLNAMRAGIAEARSPYVLIAMADGSDDLTGVDEMMRLARSGADLVAASRYMAGGHQQGGPVAKRVLSRLAGLTLHWFGVPIHDPTSNFKLYSRRLLESVTIQSTGGFELAMELTIKATLGGYRLEEIPTTWRDRTAGTSRFGSAPGYLCTSGGISSFTGVVFGSYSGRIRSRTRYRAVG